jgi:hypothetical protein
MRHALIAIASALAFTGVAMAAPATPPAKSAPMSVHAPAKATPVKAAPAKTTPVKATAIKAPAAKPAVIQAKANAAKPAPVHKIVAVNTNKVTTTTSTGKTVTYDCAKAGNQTKKACATH